MNEPAEDPQEEDPSPVSGEVALGREGLFRLACRLRCGVARLIRELALGATGDGRPGGATPT